METKVFFFFTLCAYYIKCTLLFIEFSFLTTYNLLDFLTSIYEIIILTHNMNETVAKKKLETFLIFFSLFHAYKGCPNSLLPHYIILK